MADWIEAAAAERRRSSWLFAVSLELGFGTAPIGALARYLGFNLKRHAQAAAQGAVIRPGQANVQLAVILGKRIVRAYKLVRSTS
jgi:hypothetical protein